MMLMPVGLPATKLIAMFQVSGAEEGEEASIAKLLTVNCVVKKGARHHFTLLPISNDPLQISYLISPILSFTVVGGLMASRALL